MITICNFFSFVSDGQGSIKYFDAKQRSERVIFADGSQINSYDSHTSIATFYGYKGAKEDTLNKWEYNPFTEKLTLDTQNTANDREAVMEKLNAINWASLCGDIDGVNGLIAQISIIPWFKNNGVLPEGVLLFENRAAARAAAWDAAWDAAWAAARAAAWDAAWAAAEAAAWAAARAAAWDAARDAAWAAAEAAARDAARAAAEAAAEAAALLAQLHVCDGLPIDPKHTEHVKLRWSVWEAGYGVLCDVDGVIYAYKKP